MTYLGFRRRIETGRLPRMDRLLGRATYFFPNYVRWPLAHSPSVTAVHDLSFDKLADSVDGPNAVFLRREVANSVARSDLITALTDTMADEIAEHYSVGRDRVKVVGCAADLTHFYRRSEDEVERVKADHGVYGDYVISVGNIEPRKNQVRLLDAFCALPRDITDRTMLVLVGAGAWNEAEVHRRVDAALEDGYLVKLLLGCVADSDLPALYSGARASAYVSLYEGFGMPPLESMACRTPVLASDRSVVPEVVGDAAVLADPLDQASLVEGLERILTMDIGARTDLENRGLANVARYRWADAGQALLEAVDQVSGARS
jgi:alpha-1,3-rhamnosyl/mannosyltransferase